jgi:hypothetical protein
MEGALLFGPGGGVDTCDSTSSPIGQPLRISGSDRIPSIVSRLVEALNFLLILTNSISSCPCVKRLQGGKAIVLMSAD